VSYTEYEIVLEILKWFNIAPAINALGIAPDRLRTVLVIFKLSFDSGCSIPVVHTLRVRGDRVRFPASRPKENLNRLRLVPGSIPRIQTLNWFMFSNSFPKYAETNYSKQFVNKLL
jgi:hypothetical protein